MQYILAVIRFKLLLLFKMVSTGSQSQRLKSMTRETR